jgi:hypothetical protein
MAISGGRRQSHRVWLTISGELNRLLKPATKLLEGIG